MRTFFVTLLLAGTLLAGYRNAGPTFFHSAAGWQLRQSQSSDGYTFIELDDPKGALGTRAWGISPDGLIINDSAALRGLR